MIQLARIVVCAAFAAGLPAAPSAAQSPTQWTACTGASDREWQQEVEGCTAIIDAGGTTPADRAIGYYRRGLAWLGKSFSNILTSNVPDLQRAIADFTEAIRLDPKFRDAYMNRGYAWYTAGQWRRGIDDYTEALKIDPNYARGYYLRSELWEGEGELDKAIADMTEVIRLEPNESDHYQKRGLLWLDNKDEEHAIADFTQAIRLDPKFISGYFHIAGIMVSRGQYDRAVATYSEGIAANPDDAAGLLGARGQVQFFSGDFPAAAADLLRAIEILPFSISNELFGPLFHVARARIGQDGTAVLTAQVERWKNSTPVFDLFLGRSTPEAALKATRDSVRNGCQTEFFVGQWYLIRDDRTKARQHLQAAADKRCDGVDLSYRGAIAELNRMKP